MELLVTWKSLVTVKSFKSVPCREGTSVGGLVTGHQEVIRDPLSH